MIFDLSNTEFRVYFDGNLNNGDTYYRLRLVSRFNNREILNSEDTGDGVGFRLDDPTFTDRYSRFNVDFTNANLQTLDIEGYYKWIVETSNDELQWTERATGLAKVFNSSNEQPQNKTVEYQSNDEDNQPYVFYK